MIVLALVVSPLVPPSLTKLRDIHRAILRQYLFCFVLIIIVVSVNNKHRTSVTQSIFVNKNVFVRDAFTQLFFKLVTHSRTGSGADNSEQRRAHHAECQQRSNSRYSKRCDGEAQSGATGRTHRTADGGAHRLPHARPFSVCDW